MDCIRKRAGVSGKITSFTLPLGATINMDGTAIMQGMATVFIAQMSGIDLSIFQYVQVVLLAVVASIGAAAVPSAGTITLVIILQQFGLPLEAIGIILAVDRILDMIRTSVNVTGDATVACIVAQSEEMLDKTVFDKHFELPLIELDVDVMEIPEMESDADISLPSTYFAGIINQLEIFGDTIEFSCNEDKIILNSLSVESGIRLSTPDDAKISSSSSLVIGLDTD